MKINTSRDPDILEKSNLIKNRFNEIAKNYLHEKKFIRESCPACGYEDFNFAFKKETFHYVQCSQCNSLFVLNIPVANIYNNYIDKIESEIYSSDLYSDYMRSDSKNILYDIELSLSRFIEQKSTLTVGFLGKKNMPIFSENSKLFKDPELIDFTSDKTYDIMIVNNEIESAIDIDEFIKNIIKRTHEGTCVYLTARSGSGIDLLTLWEDSFVIPLQHINLFSVEGIKTLFSRYFDIMDISTPGSFDVRNIINSESVKIPRFLNYMFRKRDEKTLEDFQNFIQKNLLSSYLVIILRRKNNEGK